MPRIGICGSSGTGKTTISKLLAKKLGIPRVKEGVRDWMKKNGVESLRGLPPAESKRMQFELLAAKINQEVSTPSFVADRTTLDNAVYALRWLAREDGVDDWMGEYLHTCLSHAEKEYDLILVLPWGVIPLQDDGVRSVKPYYQLEIQMVLEGLIASHVVIHAKTRVVRSHTVEDRLKEIGWYLK